MVLPDTVRSTLGRAGIAAGLSSEAAEALIERLRLRDLPHGETIYHEGEPGDGLYIVVTGKVKVGRRSADGREQLSAIMGPSDMFGCSPRLTPVHVLQPPRPSPKYVWPRPTAMSSVTGSAPARTSASACSKCSLAGCGEPTTTWPI